MVDLMTQWWPMAGLRVRAGDLELRYLDDGVLAELAELASLGTHAHDVMPYLVPWTRGTPVEVARSVLRYQWATRTDLPDRLNLELAVLWQGRPVAIQGLGGANFPTTRVVSSGSWLGREYQGQGIGTRMRALMLHLAFDGFGARVANTSCWVDNSASNAVTRKLGYRENGTNILMREGKPVEHLEFRMDRADWAAHRSAHPDRHPTQVLYEGLDAVRDFLALT